jgi:hypothetical protein
VWGRSKDKQLHLHRVFCGRQGVGTSPNTYDDEKRRAFEMLAALVDRILNPQDNIVPLRAANGRHILTHNVVLEGIFNFRA